MIDKSSKYYAYVKCYATKTIELTKKDVKLAFKKLFSNKDGIKAAAVTTIILSGIVYYLEPSSSAAIVLRMIRIWVEGNIYLFVGIVVLLLIHKKFWGTLRALTLGEGSWKTLRISIWTYVFSITLAFNSGVWYIADRPYYYLYAAVISQIAISTVLLSRVSVKRLVPVKGALAEDEPLSNRDDMGPYQIGALENLKEILLGQQQINSVGLYGEWGSGKTSIYEVAKQEISSTNKEFIWVEIEPWRYTSQEALVLGFYEQIGYALEKSIPGVQNTVNNLLDIAEPLVRKAEPTGILESAHRWFSSIITRKSPTPSEYIAETLKREGRYLVVAVDNVERTSDTSHVFRTLQLVHFLKDLRITYVFISEKKKLLKLIESFEADNAPAYLEKFIEYEISLFNPDTVQLNKFFIKRLNQYGIPGTFEETRTIAKNFETYRGVIKVLNLFVFELNIRFLRKGHYTINLGDKLRLDYLRAKYPLIWSHIESNRDYYDEGLRNYDDLEYFKTDEDGRKSKRREAVMTIVTNNVAKEKIENVLDILKDLFPTLKHALDNSPATYKDNENWLEERRVAAPDILDEYFARNETLADYDELVDQVNLVLDGCTEKGLNSVRTSKLLNSFLKKHRGQGDANVAIRLLIRELMRRNIKKDQQKQFFRSLIRVYAGNHKTKTLDSERVLTGILAGINRLENGLHDKPGVLKADLNYIFSGLWDYCKNPSFILRLLLFISPGRNNDLYNLQQWGGPTTGYQRYKKMMLKNINDFYSVPDNVRVIFKDLGSQEWSFVFYQWANSITSKQGNDLIPEQQYNYTSANETFLEYFQHNPDTAYECLKQDFYIKDPMSGDERKKWSASNSNSNKYDLELLIKTIEHLVHDDSLSNSKKSNLNRLNKLLIAELERRRKAKIAQDRQKARKRITV